ncbi:hypothetical protein G9P44_001966 [Scheffersomyces stipitis]|nr:hypothetical protein G9P44_001966 [Scheffersomyces stipitis]
MILGDANIGGVSKNVDSEFLSTTVSTFLYLASVGSMADERNQIEQFKIELENLQKTRSILQAVKESTNKIYQDIYDVHQVNNPQLLAEAEKLEKVIQSIP